MPNVCATLAALEAGRINQLNRRVEPLTELPAELRRALIISSDLLECPGAPALIAEALIDGVIRRHIYQRFLSGKYGEGWLVERLLLLNAAKRESISPLLRDAVFARDGYRCCLAQLGGCYGGLCLDHLIPVVLGGLSTEGAENLWTLCFGRNIRKFGHWPDEDVKAAFVASGRELPRLYFELLAQRPWREAHDLDQTWWEEVASHRRGQRRLARERRREALRTGRSLAAAAQPFRIRGGSRRLTSPHGCAESAA